MGCDAKMGETNQGEGIKINGNVYLTDSRRKWAENVLVWMFQNMSAVE